MNEEKRIENVPIHKIIPNIYQPRIKFDDKSINELSKSIKEHGIIQPLILRKLGTSYEIIDGERRYKAAKKINLNNVPAIILDIDDKEAAELILTENMQKQLLTPIEEANAYQQIMLLNKFSIEELSQKLGKEQKNIENKLKLLTLAPTIQEALLNNKISEGHARVLVKVKEKEKQLQLFNKVIKERIPVKVLEDMINKELNKKFEEKKKEETIEKKDEINLNELNKKDFLNTKKESKREEKEMNNNQLNFNQYNNLLKEQPKQEMVTNEQPQPIIGNTVIEPKQNEFFPSLEEQPLNLEVPVNNQPDFSLPTEMPQFEVPAMEVQEAEQAPMAPMMETPQVFEQPQQQTVVTDVMPAVNIIRNLIPLLENSGYRITMEELDNLNEYQVVLKVQK